MGDDRSREREPDLDKATAKAAKTTGWGIRSGGHPRTLEALRPPASNVGGAAAAAGAADGPSDSSWGSAVKKKSRTAISSDDDEEDDDDDEYEAAVARWAALREQFKEGDDDDDDGSSDSKDPFASFPELAQMDILDINDRRYKRQYFLKKELKNRYTAIATITALSISRPLLVAAAGRLTAAGSSTGTLSRRSR